MFAKARYTLPMAALLGVGLALGGPAVASADPGGLTGALADHSDQAVAITVSIPPTAASVPGGSGGTGGSGSTLATTGLDVALLAVLAVALTGGGVALVARASGRRQDGAA